MIKPLFFTTSLIVTTACLQPFEMPEVIPIHDNFIVTVEADTNIGKQTLYKQETLTHQMYDGVHAYCRQGYGPIDHYHCFQFNGDFLTQGLNVKKNKWESLSIPVKIIRTPK